MVRTRNRNCSPTAGMATPPSGCAHPPKKFQAPAEAGAPLRTAPADAGDAGEAAGPHSVAVTIDPQRLLACETAAAATAAPPPAAPTTTKARRRQLVPLPLFPVAAPPRGPLPGFWLFCGR